MSETLERGAEITKLARLLGVEAKDLGYLDANSNLFINGRKKEVIILSNGKNVYPEEIEAHYLLSPFIKELCVMGLEGEDKLYSVIVPNFEALRQRKVV